MSTLKQQICSSCLCRFYRVDRNMFPGGILAMPAVNHVQEFLLNGNFSGFFMTISMRSCCGSWRKILQECSHPLYLWQNHREESCLPFSFSFFFFFSFLEVGRLEYSGYCQNSSLLDHLFLRSLARRNRLFLELF